MTALDSFIEEISSHGLERFRVYYGEYRAKVIRNDDPESRGRIQVNVEPFGNGESIEIWVDPAFDGTGPNRGSFFPPEVGDFVRVRFDIGDPSRPVVYHGGWYPEAWVPPELAPKSGVEDNPVPERRGFISRMGHQIIWSDEKDNEFLRIIWHKASTTDPARTDRSQSANRASGDTSAVLFQPNGDVLISNSDGSVVHLDSANKQFKILAKVDGNKAAVFSMTNKGISLLDASGNSISIKNGTVTVSTSGDINVTGKSLNAVTGATFLSNVANTAIEPVILGQTYSVARATMNTSVALALTSVAAALSALASQPTLISAAPVLGAAATALSAAVSAISSFEAGAVAYLSLHTKTA